jgi:hypothetical protein
MFRGWTLKSSNCLKLEFDDKKEESGSQLQYAGAIFQNSQLRSMNELVCSYTLKCALEEHQWTDYLQLQF